MKTFGLKTKKEGVCKWSHYFYCFEVFLKENNQKNKFFLAAEYSSGQKMAKNKNKRKNIFVW